MSGVGSSDAKTTLGKEAPPPTPYLPNPGTASPHTDLASSRSFQQAPDHPSRTLPTACFPCPLSLGSALLLPRGSTGELRLGKQGREMYLRGEGVASVHSSPRTYRVGITWFTFTYFTKGFILVRRATFSLDMPLVTCRIMTLTLVRVYRG